MTGDAGAAGSPRRTRRPGTGLTVAAAAALLLGGGTAAAVGLAGRDAALPPSLPPSPRRLDDPGGVGARPRRPAPTSPSTAAPAPAARPAEAAPTPPAAAALPVSVSVPSVGIASPLLHLGLQADGTLQVPEGADFDTAAWYDGSPRPGDTGPAVIEGHVSSRADGPSVFFELAGVAVGDRVDVAREDGTTVTFEVYDVQQYPKADFPTLAVYGNTSGPELRLITCGGAFSDSDGHFTDNVVVFARAVPA